MSSGPGSLAAYISGTTAITSADRGHPGGPGAAPSGVGGRTALHRRRWLPQASAGSR